MDKQQMQDKLTVKETETERTGEKKEELAQLLAELKATDGCRVMVWQGAGSAQKRGGQAVNWSNMHAKAVACADPERPMVWVGSANWSLTANKDSAEHSLLVRGDLALAQAHAEFVTTLADRADAEELALGDE